MNFYFTGGCTNGAPGACTGPNNCPGACVGNNPSSGTPVSCAGANTGVSLSWNVFPPTKMLTSQIVITFC